MTDPMTPTRPSDPAVNEAATKAGQAMEAWLREPDDYEWGRRVTAAIRAVEDEARRNTVERIRGWLETYSYDQGDREFGWKAEVRAILDEAGR